MLLSLLSLAMGAECEQAFSPAELRAVIGRAKAAIENGDPAAHVRASDELTAGVECLEAQLPSKEWADYLVTEALIKYSEKTPGWEKALKLALELVPDHPDVQDFILDDYLEPPAPSGEAKPIPKGMVVFIDGKIVTGQIPPLDGLHVVQVVENGAWKSKLLRGEPFPDHWLQVEPVEPPVPERKTDQLASWGTVGLYGGFANWSQTRVSDDPSIADRSASGPHFGIAGMGQLYFVKPMGVFVWADGSLQNAADPDGKTRPAGFADGFLGLSFLDSPLALWVGGGVTTVRVQELDKERPFAMPHYLVGLSFRSGGGVPLDVTAGGGLMTWGWHVRAEAGATILPIGPAGLRVGGRFKLASAKLGNANLRISERDLLARGQQLTAGLFVGLAFGGGD